LAKFIAIVFSSCFYKRFDDIDVTVEFRQPEQLPSQFVIVFGSCTKVKLQPVRDATLAEEREIPCDVEPEELVSMDAIEHQLKTKILM
jgi:hypothetical protein